MDVRMLVVTEVLRTRRGKSFCEPRQSMLSFFHGVFIVGVFFLNGALRFRSIAALDTYDD